MVQLQRLELMELLHAITGLHRVFPRQLFSFENCSRLGAAHLLNKIDRLNYESFLSKATRTAWQQDLTRRSAAAAALFPGSNYRPPAAVTRTQFPAPASLLLENC